MRPLVLSAKKSRDSAGAGGAARRFNTTVRDDIWPMIWAVDGAYWLLMTVAEILAYWGFAGTTHDGVYVLSPSARTACAYWIVLVQGWPSGLYARARVILIQVGLALVCVRLMSLSVALAGAVIDEQWSELGDFISRSVHFQASTFDWAWAFRITLPRYALGLLLVAFVRLVRRYHRDSVRMATLSAEHAHTQLAILSAQLQPHFLFNALNVITELVAQSPDRATEMLMRLGDFLRHALETSKQPWVSVQSELAAIEAYLAVQQVRYGDLLQVQILVDDAAARLIIPSLLLQPLVENAVDHGRAGLKDSLIVRIECRRLAEHLHVMITNSTPRLTESMAPSSYGYGLQNVDSRLKAAYGDSATLDIGPGPLQGTQALITMPALVEPPAMSAATSLPGRGLL